MTLALDMPACKPSIVQRLDPRWKLAGILLVTVAMGMLRTGAPAGVALLGALVLVGLARLPLRWYLRRLGAATLLFVVFLCWMPFVLEEGDVPLDLGILTLSQTGLERLATLSARLVGMLSLMLVLLATAPLHETLKAARSLLIPGLLIQLVLLTHRYVFLLLEEFGRLRTALRVRGFRNRADLRSYKTVGQVAGTLLVRSYERSERVGQAMRCRGFDGKFRSLHEFQTRPADILAFVLLASWAVGLAAWDWYVR